MEGPDERARVLKAMGHPSRLRMLDSLAGGEQCVCELQRLVGSDMSTVSRHLSVLREAGLVESRKEGLWVHYRLSDRFVERVRGGVGSLLEAAPAHRAARC